MTIQDLTNRMNAAEDKMNKCLATIERHKTQKQKKIDKFNELGYGKYNELTYNQIRGLRDTNKIDNEAFWLYMDIGHKDDDIKGATQKYEDAKKIFKNWQIKLGAEEAKQQIIANDIPQVIKDFLNECKVDTYNYYVEKANEFIKDRDELKEFRNKAFWQYIVEHKDNYEYLFKFDDFDYNSTKNYSDYIGYGQKYTNIKRTMGIAEKEQQFEMKYADPTFKQFKSMRFDTEWLDKVLTEEMNRKLLDLMARVTKITGTITDAQLRVRMGDLNGNVIGERGIANVYTIGAGGYAVQRWHTRVLVKKIG
jgi:hypothetical protein